MSSDTIHLAPETLRLREPALPLIRAAATIERLRLARWAWTVPLLAALALGTIFLWGTSGSQDDDGYIFFQYARHLAAGDGLSFNPGIVSYGVTSGAWVLLLAGVHAFLRADIVAEGQALGLGLFALSAALWTAALTRWSGRPLLGLLGGLAYVLELDALKASLNGLETGLDLAVLGALAWLLARRPLAHPILLGAVCGLAVLTRPDNLAWAGVALAYAAAVGVQAAASSPARARGGVPHVAPVFKFHSWDMWMETARRGGRTWLPALALVAAVALLIAGPWYIWLWAATGSPLPPTQTGKLLVFLPMNVGITLGQYEHFTLWRRLAIGLQALRDFTRGGVPERLALFGTLLVAALSVLLASRPRTRPYAAWPLALLLAVALQTLLFAGTFPLLKLRYLIALLPVGVGVLTAIFGLIVTGEQAGWATVAAGWGAARRRAALALLLLVVAGGLALYSREVGRQVANYRYYVAVQAVRADVGRWLQAHTAPASLVALEPIGGVGFYSGRRVLDLGGLTDKTIWPDLVHGYNDADAVARLLHARQADYLVDYTHPAGVGGTSAAVARIPGARPVAVVQSPAVLAGSRAAYGSYTIYSLRAASR